MKSLKEDIENSLKVLPKKPGVYKFIDANDAIIYIGKAKNLKNRVQSYFSGKHEHFKTKMLVKSISKIETIVVQHEADALILENNLIKSHQPKYNVLLKDDKTYPWIEVRKEPFPRITTTRNKEHKNATYFGPFPNVRYMNVMIKLIHDLFPVRSCSLDLSPEKIAKNKYSVCLEYHIGNCLGPCASKQEERDYDDMVQKIVLLLEGKTYSLCQILKSQMKVYAENYEFEKAEEIKKTLIGLDQYRNKSIIASNLHDLDVLCVDEIEDAFYFNYMVIKEGAIVNAYNQKVSKKLNESMEDFILLNLSVLQEKFGSTNTSIITNVKIQFISKEFTFVTPQKGDKKNLLDLSENNVRHFVRNEKKKQVLASEKKNNTRILETLKKDFKLNTLPLHMECFDNSNLQGTNAVSACVVFKNGKPSKKEYRHFNVKTVIGPDDFETMKEVVYRRYKRLIDEKKKLPDLIVIDGGKGQLHAANEALDQLGLKGRQAIVGIAKRLEELFFPGDKHPLHLDKRSESLKVIQHMRNEAHRFSISHHRNKRSKVLVKSELENIPGIGPKTKALLFQKLKTIESIKKATISELSEIIGAKKATLLFHYFDKN